MIAGDEDHLAVRADALADRVQDRLGDRHRLRRAALQQLDGVAEQDEAVDVVERAEQRRERLRVAQDVALEARAEVQVGDDERAHGRRDDARPAGPPSPVPDPRAARRVRLAPLRPGGPEAMVVGVMIDR